MKKLVILGGSGIGMIAASIAETVGEYEVSGFLNDVIDVGTQIGKYKKIPVIGKTDDLPRLLNDSQTYVFIAYVGLQNEKQTFEKISGLGIPDDRYASLIHPTAIIPKGYVGLGKGILIAPLAQLSPDSTLSDNCLMLANSFLGHDSFMDRFAHLATNSVVGANVRVGKAVHVGSNATIREKVTIGHYSLIGAGSMVLNDVPENAVVVGNPARVLKLRDSH
jgi:acetyltransferase EpsM